MTLLTVIYGVIFVIIILFISIVIFYERDLTKEKNEKLKYYFQYKIYKKRASELAIEFEDIEFRKTALKQRKKNKQTKGTNETKQQK